MVALFLMGASCLVPVGEQQEGTLEPRADLADLSGALQLRELDRVRAALAGSPLLKGELPIDGEAGGGTGDALLLQQRD